MHCISFQKIRAYLRKVTTCEQRITQLTLHQLQRFISQLSKAYNYFEYDNTSVQVTACDNTYCKPTRLDEYAYSQYKIYIYMHRYSPLRMFTLGNLQ